MQNYEMSLIIGGKLCRSSNKKRLFEITEKIWSNVRNKGIIYTVVMMTAVRFSKNANHLSLLVHSPYETLPVLLTPPGLQHYEIIL